MDAASARRRAIAALAGAGIPFPAREADLLLASATGQPSAFLLAHPEFSLDEAMRSTLVGMVSRRSSREPLQYILGEWAFYGHPLAVSDRVLVPRPETELLVERALEWLPDDGTFLDWGTGSGCIAIALLIERPSCSCIAVDASPSALDVAWRNMRRHDVLHRALLWHSRTPRDIPLRGERLALIVSNPPYIPTALLPTLMEEVRREPMVALDGGVDGLKWYRALLEWAPGALRPGGRILVEVGDGQQAVALSSLPLSGLRHERTVHDLAGVPRMVQWIRV